MHVLIGPQKDLVSMDQYLLYPHVGSPQVQTIEVFLPECKVLDPCMRKVCYDQALGISSPGVSFV